MDDLTRLVDASLARHGVRPIVDHHRLEWSRWFRCESSFGLWLVPNQPGLFALGEEVIAPGENIATGGKRMLAIFHIAEARDLGVALGRLFTSSHPLYERMAQGRCFARYAVVTDAGERATCLAAFQRWLDSSAETASGFSADTDGALNSNPSGWSSASPDRIDAREPAKTAEQAETTASDSISPPPLFPSGF